MNTSLFELWQHSANFIELTPHQVACYWENYPNTAKWYINNGKPLDAANASHSYDVSKNTLGMDVSVNCSLHPIVSSITLTADTSTTVDAAINKAIQRQKNLQDA